MINRIIALSGACLLVFAGCGGGAVSVVDADEAVDDVFDIEVDLPGDINNPETMDEDDYMDMIDAYSDLFEDPNGDGKVKGSCNSVAENSVCIDYMGSFWTEEQMKLNCTGPEVSFSKNTCPYPEIGGCKSGGGTITEIIIWYYPYGGEPITGELIDITRQVCNVTYMSQWTMPEF